MNTRAAKPALAGALHAGGSLFIVPRTHRDGFEASIRDHMLDLVDPSSQGQLAPTPDDLFVASYAAELAWSARTFLRTRGLPDSVDVTAGWHTPEDWQSVPALHLTVAVSGRAQEHHAALGTLLEQSLAARSLATQIVQVAFKPEPDDERRR